MQSMEKSSKYKSRQLINEIINLQGKDVEFKYSSSIKYPRLTITEDRVTMKFPYSIEVDENLVEFFLNIAKNYKDTKYILRGKLCKKKKFKYPFLSLHRTENGKTIHVKAHFYKK